MLSIICAISNNNVIGKNNKLIWNLPEDLKRFKEITSGHTIIMGRKTFESIGRILPNRKHVIFSKNPNFKINNPNVEIVHDISQINPYINSNDECFVIGGENIYKLLIPYVQKMYITKIHYNFDGDTYFPEIKLTDWVILDRQTGIKDEKNPYNYEYITYIKKK